MRIWITPHAVDRASQRLLEHWLKECPDRNPGLMTWLQRRVEEALRTTIVRRGRHLHMQQRGLSFECNEKHGTLFVKTVVDGNDPSRPRATAAKDPHRCRVCEEIKAECQCP